ncbi:endonuclease [Polaribacter septentrionalilitoris]|uniref:endonuclease n=1 Tax=Polaribacter septentrionalilitoris TaxID=2494657 RepID=UPI00135B4F4D|nr:endonuclease [Polaribacter septentrionalilitoris]
MIKKTALFLIVLFVSYNLLSQESYYNDVNLNLTGITLKEELATKIINTHTRFLFYDQIWSASKVTDVNQEDTSQVVLIYGWENGSDTDITNNRTRGIDNNGGSVGQWNREHVFSRSLGTPNLGESGPGSDAHHLRPSDVQRNSSRGNKKFAIGSGANSGASNGGWYPGDEWKGDVARMMMYLYLRYGNRCLPTNVGIGNSSATPDDMIDLFLQWNAEDPVSNFEKQRNTYHENTLNPYAQGNRNPFIDNPRLATRIWGGPEAEDSWGIYSNNDTESPSIPTNLSTANITTFSVDLSWTAATDNVAVTSYDVFVEGNLKTNTSNTSVTISGLNSNTAYALTVIAKDLANNKSNESSPVNVTTLQDTKAPSTPTNITVSNETGTSFIVSWSEAIDNTGVTAYDIYIDNTFYVSTNQINYTVTDLNISTTYSIQILAKDAAGNSSPLSTAINATTTDGSTTTANELFFSEYVEGSSNNKALEIVNLTSNDIDLSSYSIKRQSNGGVNGNDWEETVVLTLTGYTIKSNTTFVIVNGSADEQLLAKADHIQPNASETNWGAPISFNGNDPVGLFKNNILIDVIGTYNGGSSNFAKNKTLRRKSDVSQANTNFDLNNEWDVFPEDTFDDMGNHSAITLSSDSFSSNNLQFFPNPVDDVLRIRNSSNKSISNFKIIDFLGKEVFYQKNSSEEINIQKLSKGIYLLKFEVDNKTYSTKFIKK